MTLLAPYAPVPVEDVDVAFPAHAMDVMPPMRDIPQKYLRNHPYHLLLHAWMFTGLDEKVEFHMQPGVDGATAYRHLSVIVGSYQPKHEHKMAAFAFLCAQWFTKVVNNGTTYEEIS